MHRFLSNNYCDLEGRFWYFFWKTAMHKTSYSVFKGSSATLFLGNNMLLRDKIPFSSSIVFDIPPRTRRLILISGCVAVTFIVMGSLLSHGKYVEVDKIIHFSGYFVLGSLFTLSVRPKFYIPTLLLLGCMGMAIEFTQLFTGRSFDLKDQLANVLGAFSGAAAGLLARMVYSYLRTEYINSEDRKNTLYFQKGDVIFRQGDSSKKLYVVKQGKIKIERTVEGKKYNIATVETGDVIGEMGVLQDLPRYASAIALRACFVYAMDREQLLAKVGGVEHPAVQVIRVLAQRLQVANEKIEELQKHPQ